MKAKTQPLSSQSIRRLQAGGLILRKFEVDEIAEITEASRSSVYRWKKVLREGGDDLAALRRKHSSGRKRKLSDEQMNQLREMLEGSAKSYGYDNDLWSSKVVADLIAKKFHVTLTSRAVRYILKEFGLSYQKPIVKDKRQSTEEVDLWISRTWPRIKKKRKSVVFR